VSGNIEILAKKGVFTVRKLENIVYVGAETLAVRAIVMGYCFFLANV
jgi:hypothetical protein